MKKFLNENKLGPYSKLQENVSLDTTKLKMFIKALVSLGGGKQDKQDYKDIANLLIQNKLADAAEMIRYMDTAPNEMIYSAMMRTYPDLWDTLFDNPPGDYIALAKPKAGLPEKKLANEDYAGAEEEKMMDFLAEYEVTYVIRGGKCHRIDDDGNDDIVDMDKCRRAGVREEKEVEEASQGDLMAIERIEEIVNNLARNISTNSNIPTQEKLGLVQSLKELKDLVEDLGASVEMEMGDDDNYLIDPTYKNEAMGGKNPEGDKLVLRFLQGISKKFNYPVAQAARFVKDTIKSLGY